MTRTLLVALVTLGDPARLTGGYLFHQRLAQLAPAHDARLEFVSFPDRPFPLAVLDAPQVLARVNALGAHVLVLDSIAAAFIAPWLATPAEKIPVVGMLHQPPGGIDHGKVRTSVQAALDRLAYRHAARLLVASDALAADFTHLRVAPAQRIFVVPPGRDVAGVVGPLPDNPRQGRQAAFLCVANWVARKGILSLLDAFGMLEPDTGTLHLVGDDRAEPAYAARVWQRLERADLAGRVFVHGPLSIEAVAAWYGAVDAFVLPSLIEPFGTVYGEAMAFGLPVVGWRAGNLPHLAEHEKEGLILTPGDLAGLAAAMRRLARDEVLRQRLGSAARQRALQRPTWHDVASVFFDHLRAVTAHVSGAA